MLFIIIDTYKFYVGIIIIPNIHNLKWYQKKKSSNKKKHGGNRRKRKKSWVKMSSSTL